MNVIRKLIAVFSIVLFVFMASINIYAIDSNIDYSGNSGDFIFQPGSNSSPTDLFSDLKNVMPGDTISQKITVKNKADNKVKVKIYIRSLGADESSTDFLSKLTLTVSKENASSPMFDAKANETAGLTDWTEIGILYSGGEINLNLILNVPTSLDNNYQKQTGKITWQFMAIEIPVDEEPWVCPNCNESHYHIEDYTDHAKYVCENCGHTEEMLCEICDGRMHKVIYKDGIGKEWYYYICENDADHHSEPSPVTGETNSIIWIVVILSVCIIALVILLYIKRRKDKDKGAKHDNEEDTN